MITFIWTYLPYLLLVGLVVIIFLLAAMIGTKKETLEAAKKAALAQDKKPINAILLNITPTTISDRLNLPGLIEAWTDLTLSAKVGGTIDNVLVRKGDQVSEGQVLAHIDERDYILRRNGAQASYNLALANYKRSRTLYDKGMTPTAELDLARTAMETSLASLEDAKLNLSRCTIKAPMNGVVEHLPAKVGLFLAVGDPIAKILKIDQVKAVIGIPESDVAAVRALDQVEITLQALENRTVKAKIHFLSSAPDNVARLYRLELALDNKDHAILPGMFVRAEVVKHRAQNAVSVPLYSVVARNDEQYVYVAQEGRAVKRQVTLGIMEGWRVQVSKGLAFGEQILVEGHRDVENNDAIKVIRVIDNPGVLP